jgi:hypothetical protein
MVFLVAGAMAIAPSSGYADHIFATVDGVNVGPANHDVCGLLGDPYLVLANDCTGSTKTYNRLVISGAGAGNPARIVVKSDGNQDNLTLTGATIKTNLAAGSTLTDGSLSLWTVPLASLPNTTTYGGDIGYQLDVVGSFFRPGSKPLNDRIWVDSYLQHPTSDPWNPAMNHYDKTMSSTLCTTNNVPCYFSNAPATPYNIVPGFDDNRGVKTSLLITIKSGDTLTIPANGVVVKSTAPGGTADESPSPTNGCPSGPLSTICSTAKALGCYACATQQTATKEQQAELFMSSNWENLSQDLARGNGEHLASLATLLKVPAEQQAEFFSLVQHDYTTLAAYNKTGSESILHKLQRAMMSSPNLAKVVHEPAE